MWLALIFRTCAVVIFVVKFPTFPSVHSNRANSVRWLHYECRLVFYSLLGCANVCTHLDCSVCKASLWVWHDTPRNDPKKYETMPINQCYLPYYPCICLSLFHLRSNPIFWLSALFPPIFLLLFFLPLCNASSCPAHLSLRGRMNDLGHWERKREG